MSSTFFGLNIGKTGLYTYQSALNTTSHNITNAETEGYSKQVVNQQADKAIRVNATYGMAGTGVTVTGVTQMRDNYYDVKYWNGNTVFGEYSYKSNYMSEIQNYFNEVSVEGFTTTFNTMYKSLQELVKNPSSPTVRTQTVKEAESLTQYFNSVSQNLKDIQEKCNFEVKNLVDQINSSSQQIAALTKQINTIESGGGTANDLRDQRALLVDKLSEIANISVSEKVVGDNVGVTSYRVLINDQVLVEDIYYETLKVVPREEKVNQNDIDGLYEITWENGQRFHGESLNMGGSLQALLEVRDGNEQGNLTGTVSAATVSTVGDKTTTTITLTKASINQVEKLNIPEEGVLTLNNREYKYTGFKVTVGGDGKFTYEFKLEGAVAGDVSGKSVSVGKSVDYKGIPYYMGMLNEFVRTYAKAFNEIHRTGEDLNGNSGADFFTATNQASGRQYAFGVPGSSVSYDAATFHSGTGEYYANVPEGQPFYGSYYSMTAENFTVSSGLLTDPSKLAAAADVNDGKENNDVAEALLALKKDEKMFAQGTPNGFIESLVDDIGIDTKKAENFSKSQSDILAAIKNQRLSISGVDMDEEAMNLIRFQSAYNMSAKVISVMDEIYDKLINYMGV